MSLIEHALRERYCKPAWAIFFNVSNGTGAHLKGYADALAMSLFPSRGLDLHGFEVKSDRQDWLSELKNPEKAERFARHCHYWWLVVGDENVAKKEEVPPPWGVLTMRGKSLRQTRAAKRLDPEPLGYPFLAAVLRRANEAADDERKKTSGKHSMSQAVMDSYERGHKAGVSEGLEDSKELVRDHESLKESLEDFEKASGVKIDRWHGGKIGQAVHTILNSRGWDTSHTLDGVIGHLERTMEELREQSKAMKEAVKSRQIP